MRAKEIPLTEDQERRSIDRIDLVLLVWTLVALVLLGRAFYIQIVQHSYYTWTGRQAIHFKGAG
jgi:cell division protein FtsI/penicillin-binding protein 2